MTDRSAPGSPRPVTPGGILVEELIAIRDQLAGTPGVTDEQRRRLDAAVRLASGLDPYLESLTTPPSPALRTLAERTAAEDWSTHGPDGPGALEQEMLSGHVEGQLLKLLVHATRARQVLEIGLFTGYSALAMAEALPTGGRLVACELDAEVAEMARRNLAESAHGTKVEIRVGPAADTVRELAAVGESFDLVFVDADKAGYAGYLDAVLTGRLLAPHGLLCVDNTLLQGQPWRGGTPSDAGAAIAAFNQLVADDPRLEQVVVPLRDGITLARVVG